MRAARERCGEGNEGQVVGVGTARYMHGVVVMTPRRTPQCMGVGFTGFDLPCSLLFFWWLSTCAVLAFSFYPTGLHTVYRHACVSCPLPRSYIHFFRCGRSKRCNLTPYLRLLQSGSTPLSVAGRGNNVSEEAKTNTIALLRACQDHQRRAISSLRQPNHEL